MASANILGADGVVAKQYLPPIFTGDITAVIAGTGLGGGGVIGDVTLTNIGVLSVDATPGGKITVDNTDPQNPKIANDGVLSVVAGDGIAVDNTDPNNPIVSTDVPAGLYYKTASQTISANPTPQTTNITFQLAAPWSDTTAITQTSTSSWTVARNGLYQLELQISYAISATATFGDTLHFGNIRLTRGGNGATIASSSQNISGYISTYPTSRALQVQCLYALEVGDVLSFQSFDWVTANTWSISPQSGAPFDFDYNSYWSWRLVKPLP